MKKILTLFIAILMMLPLLCCVSCNGTPDEPGPQEPTPPSDDPGSDILPEDEEPERTADEKKADKVNRRRELDGAV